MTSAEMEASMPDGRTPRPHVRTRGVSLLLRSCPEFLELLSGGLLCGWGLMVAAPWNMFDGVPSFAAMRVLWPDELVWGLIAASIGLAQVVALLTGRYQARRICTLGVFLGWLFLWYMILLADWRTPSTLIYLGLAASAGWVNLRLKVKDLVVDPGVK